MPQLWPHQVRNAQRLAEIIRTRGAAVDASDVGTGKTFTALRVMQELGDPPTLVVCPLAVVPGWEQAAEALGVTCSVIHYERLRTGRTEFGRWARPRQFVFAPGVRFVVWDEVHRCKGFSSLQSHMLRACRNQRLWTLGLSATLAESPLEMQALGYVLRLHDGWAPGPSGRSYAAWAAQYGVGPGRWSRYEWRGAAEDRQQAMLRLRAELFPRCGVRTTREELQSLFPEGQVCVEAWDFGTERLNEAYQAMAQELQTLRETQTADRPSHLVSLLRWRQEIELLKVPALVEAVRDLLIVPNVQVVCWLNFRDSVWALADRLGTDMVIVGDDDAGRRAPLRTQVIDRFQRGVDRVLIGTMSAGGIGISLHDVLGDRPRVVFLNPGWSARELRQALGRCHRAGGRTPVLQRILCAAGTVEMRVFQALQDKLACLDLLQDGELIPFPYDELRSYA